MPEKLWSSRLLRLTAALALGNTAAFVADAASDQRWVKVLSLLMAGTSSLLTGWMCVRLPGRGAGRRFWLMTGGGQFLFALSLLLRLDYLGIDLSGLPLICQVSHVAGVVLVVGAVLVLPMRSITRRQLIALALDLSIVLAAGALFVWHLVVLPITSGNSTAAELGPTIGNLAGGVIGIVLVMKLTSGRDDYLTRGALRMIGASALVGGLGTAVASLLDRWPDLDPTFVVNGFGALVVALAARHQMIESVEPAGRRRPYTLYPYLAVAAVGLLLIGAVATDASDDLAIAVASLVLAVVVGARQVLALRENDRLVERTQRDEQRFRRLATHDTLTGLANRALFADQVERSVADSRPDHRFTVVLVDLDDFKTVNDTLGHHVGDGLLVAVAERMRAGVRPIDTVARLGGDEFAILFDDLGSEPVDRALRRIAEALLVPIEVDGQLLSVRASFGVAEGGPGDDAGDLLRHADIAMYEVKARGHGGHQRYVTGMESRWAERSRRDAELRRALAEDQFVLHYQPIVALPGGRLTGLEALVRWQHPDRGLLGPAEFIAAAEETGLIVPLGRWVLRTAVRQAAAWRAELGSAAPRTVSVNASPHQLQGPEFAAEVAAALAAADLPAACLTVEITESTAVGGGATQANLAAIRELGVRVALDDFGTGASTLSLLLDCRVDQVKLDRSFVPAPGREAIARAVLQLTRAMGVDAVAEGVETAEQAATLAGMGYRRAQGYHFARPMPAGDLSRMLTLTAVRG